MWIAPPGGAYNQGYLAGQVLPAEFENYFLGSLTSNGNVEQQAITSTVTELDNLLAYYSVTPVSGTNTQIRDLLTNYLDNIKNAVTESGLPWVTTDSYLLSKSEIAKSHVLGETIYVDYPLTQVIFPNAKSSANPGNAQYLPVIARNVDKTVSTTQAPNLVPLLRAAAASILGNTSFTGTVAGAVITFAITTTITAMLNAVVNHGLVRRWFSSGQSATFAAIGPDFTGMTVTINGTEFGISAISVGSGTITTTGSPTIGSQTMQLFPHRIAGSTTSAFLPRLSGFVPVVSDDVDGLEIGMYQHMDFGQGHWHQFTSVNNAVAPNTGVITTSLGNTPAVLATQGGVQSPITDGSNGSPRLGKNFKPMSDVKLAYTWVDYLDAAV